MEIFIILVICIFLQSLIINHRNRTFIEIAIWMTFLPGILATTLLVQNIPSEAFHQFILFLIVYASIWWQGAFIFGIRQYKAAISLIGAIIATTIAITTYFYYLELITLHMYRSISLVLSPFIFAGVWGKFFIDFREMLIEESETLMGFLKKKLFSKPFLDFIDSIIDFIIDYRKKRLPIENNELNERFFSCPYCLTENREFARIKLHVKSNGKVASWDCNGQEPECVIGATLAYTIGVE